MLLKLEKLKERLDEIQNALLDSDTVKDIEKYTQLNKEFSELKPIVEKFDEYNETIIRNEGATSLLESEDDEIKELAQIELDEYKYLINHILVAPEGYDQGWNIAKEDTKAPDLDFIKKIILHLKTFEKIDTDQISIIGHSNGAALVNQLLIELESESFKKAVFTFCQLNAFQYREGSFWARSNIDSEVHDLAVLPASNNRKILSFAGTEDTACIYYGGEGIHKYNFVNAELAAFVWAKAFGYEGVQIENPIEEAAPLENFYRFSYLDGKVIHLSLIHI